MLTLRQKRFGIMSLALLLLALRHEAFSPTSTAAQLSCDGLGATLYAAPKLTVNGRLKNLASGDFNRDGKADVAVTADRSYSTSSQFFSLWVVIIYQGDGTGSFEAVSEIRFENVTLDALATRDFNRDGKLDLFVTGFPLGIAVLLGQGDGTFGQPLAQSLSLGEARYALDDFTGDGNLDLAIAEFANRELHLFRGLGNGTFTALPKLTGNPILAITSGDFDGDHKPDLAFIGFGDSTFSLLLNNGTGGFKAPVSFFVLGAPATLAAGDLNNDGKVDVALVGNQEVTLLNGNGNASFTAPQVARGPYGDRALTADFNRDGRLDLLTVGNNTVTLFYNDAVTGFTEVGGFYGGVSLRDVSAAEVNGDTALDLVAANYSPHDSNSHATILLGNAKGFQTASLTPNVFLRGNLLKVADFNKDNKPDLYLAQEFTNGVIFMLNEGQGKFAKPVTLSTQAHTTVNAVAADFTEDGNVDFALALTMPGSPTPNNVIVVIRGQGDGTFIIISNPQTFPLTGVPAGLVISDFNNDNLPDLAVTIPALNQINVLLNTGAGRFGAARTFNVGLDPRSLAVGDFNGDAKPDLVVGNRNSATLSLLLNDGNGGFVSSLIGVGGNPREIEAADFNGDSRLDLLVTHNNAAALSLLLATTPGAFATPRLLNLKTIPAYVTKGDFNRDGKLDVAVSRTPAGLDFQIFTTLDRYAGDGTGGFSSGVELPIAGAGPLAAADFNGDDLTDLASVPFGSNGLWVSYGQCRSTSNVTLVNVSAASYRRAQLAPETIVSAFGTNLSDRIQAAGVLPLPTTLAGTQVRVRDVLGVERQAPLFFVSPTQINYLMPVGTAYGTASISVINNGNVKGTATTQITQISPGLFSANADGQGVAAGIALRVKPNGSQVTEPIAQYDSLTNQFLPLEIDLGLNPIASLDKVYLAIFGTGWRMRSQLQNVKVYVGGQPFEPLYAGAQGLYAGVDQLNFQLSQNLSQRGVLDIQIVVDGKICNAVTLKIR